LISQFISLEQICRHNGHLHAPKKYTPETGRLKNTAKVIHKSANKGRIFGIYYLEPVYIVQ
jgi:hypothetical protein